MPKVQYVGDSDVRRVRQKDFSNNGLDHKAVEWSRANRFVVDIDGDDVAEFLAAHGDGEFKIIKDDAEPAKVAAESKTGTHKARGGKPGRGNSVASPATGTAPRTDTRTGGASA